MIEGMEAGRSHSRNDSAESPIERPIKEAPRHPQTIEWVRYWSDRLDRGTQALAWLHRSLKFVVDRSEASTRARSDIAEHHPVAVAL